MSWDLRLRSPHGDQARAPTEPKEGRGPDENSGWPVVMVHGQRKWGDEDGGRKALGPRKHQQPMVTLHQWKNSVSRLESIGLPGWIETALASAGRPGWHQDLAEWKVTEVHEEGLP